MLPTGRSKPQPRLAPRSWSFSGALLNFALHHIRLVMSNFHDMDFSDPKRKSRYLSKIIMVALLTAMCVVMLTQPPCHKKAPSVICQHVFPGFLATDVTYDQILLSSANQDLQPVLAAKRHILALNMKDLANPNIMNMWLDHFQSCKQDCISLNAHSSNSNYQVVCSHLICFCERVLYKKAKMTAPVQEGEERKSSFLVVAEVPTKHRPSSKTDLVAVFVYLIADFVIALGLVADFVIALGLVTNFVHLVV
ncbi:uncharacterized protein LOC123441523 [Hordeum vulgare subsp. vulgare]|uniref:uncharacterized protein LOC123441523 n=1 Tax=Hordeum vulgare subsp. vulgare TaxID=112509 RepID=UPI001D1A351A|nr:uncharacterized protein LOC123441523 [Hordeum vulgare subsp. vulgare]